MTEEKPRRSRGVRLNDLDRRKVYRIWHTGRRWEVLGAEGDPEAAGGPADGCTGVSAGGVRTVRAPGVPAVPDAIRPEGS